MNPFRRDAADKAAPSAAPSGAVDDQWFRPEEPAPAAARGRTSGRGRGASATAAAAGSSGAGRPKTPAAADAPTESFVPPPNWLEEKGEAGKAAKAGGGAGAGAGGAGGSGGSGGGKGPGKGPGRGAGGAGSAPRKKKKKRRLQRVLWTMLTIITIGFFMVLVAYSRLEIPEANETALQQTTRVYYEGGEVEIGRFGDINRTIVRLDQMPISLRDAVLAVENRNFYNDNGVSPKGMARAFWNNLSGGSTQGGSTITQQYVKNTYLTTERSLQRKLKEAMLAIKIDKEKPKDKILEDYLNTIFLGRGAYGVQAAAKAYFNKDVSDLDAAEGAVLAAVIPAPSTYDPSEKDGLARLKNRWVVVVDSMVETGTLTPEARAKMKFPKIPKQAQSESRFGGQKGYILNAVRAELLDRGLTRDQIENGGLRIVTTLDPQAQQAAVDAVKEEFPVSDDKGLRVGLSAVQPGTGRVLAMYGGEDFLGKGRYAQVNTATYPIQSGSTAKIFTTAALLENGFTLDSRFDGDSPLELAGSRPVNNQGFVDFGSVTLKRSLEKSINTAFVDAVTEVGAQTVKDTMVKAGIPRKTPGLDVNARITLGIASTPNIDVAGAIATICGGGIRAEHHIVDRVIGLNGGPLQISKPEITKESVFSANTIAGTLEAMQAVVQVGTGGEAKRLNRPAGGKTGTHEGLTAWFSGCTPQIAAAVNYFKGDGTKELSPVNGLSGFTGGSVPAATWTTFMRAALRGEPVEDFPKVEDKDKDRPTPTPTPRDPFDTSSGFPGDPVGPPETSDPGGGIDFPDLDPETEVEGPACTDSPFEEGPTPYDPGCQDGERPEKASTCSEFPNTEFPFMPGCKDGQPPPKPTPPPSDGDCDPETDEDCVEPPEECTPEQEEDGECTTVEETGPPRPGPGADGEGNGAVRPSPPGRPTRD